MEPFSFKRKQDRTKEMGKKHEQQSNDFRELERKYFDLLKDITILSATIFATSIALSVSRSVNNIFIAGEFLLLISTFAGSLYLWSQLKAKEWTYFFEVKGTLESDLILNKDIMEDFEKKTTEDLIKDYKRLMDQKDITYYILRIIKVDWLPILTYLTFSTGVILIWSSLLV